jgi:hypothetical protein
MEIRSRITIWAVVFYRRQARIVASVHPPEIDRIASIADIDQPSIELDVILLARDRFVPIMILP